MPDRVFPPFQATKVGSSATFICEFGQLYSLWYHNGSSKVLDIGLSITISNVVEEDSGKYECVEQNVNNEILRGKGHLKVRGKFCCATSCNYALGSVKFQHNGQLGPCLFFLINRYFFRVRQNS